MKVYCVWLSSNARLALPTPVQVRSADALVEAVSLLDPVGPFIPGLLFCARVSAESLKHAMVGGANAAAHLIDALAWAHATEIADPVPVVAIEADDSSCGREFGQFVRSLPLSVLPGRFFRESSVGVFYTKWCAVPDGPLRERVSRALRLFRRSLSDADPIDRFEDAWGALEAINPLLQQKYDLPTKFASRTCKNCGEPIEVVGGSAGIKYAVVNLAGLDAEIWKKAIKLRTDVVHGIATHDSLAARIPELLPAVYRAVSAAILDLVQATDANLEDFIRAPLNACGNGQALFTATLVGWRPSSIFRIEDLPYGDLILAERDRKGDLDVPGTKSVTFDLKFTPRNLTGTMCNISMEVLVAKDPEDATATLIQSGFSITKSEENNTLVPDR